MATQKTHRFVLAAILSALIIVMTVVPYTGYIYYGGIEITTLHIVVMLGAFFLGPYYGALLGTVWGATCLLRAFTNPLWILFTNPMISLVPRILVGLGAGLIFAALKKSRLSEPLAVGLSAAFSTLLNTVLVLSAMYIFGGMIESYQSFFEMFETMFLTLLTLNGAVEIIGAVLIVPVLYRILSRARRV